MSLFCGVDPGLTGAVALLDDEKTIDVWDLPIVGTASNKRLDAKQLWVDIQAGCDGNRPYPAVAAIEKMTIIPGRMGSIAIRSKGEVFGALRAVFELMGSRLIIVPAGTWKKRFGLIFPRGTLDKERKEASRELAMRLFPERRDDLARKMDHGRAEALLIAEHLRQQHMGG